MTSQPPLLGRLAIAYYCATFGLFTWIWVSIILLCRSFPVLFIPAIAYAIYAIGPGAVPSTDASWPKSLWKWGMWKAMATYFPQCKLHKTADLPPNKSYIFGQHPHGVLAYGTWLGFGTSALGFDVLFPGIDARVTTLNINFRAPFLREYLLLLGVCSVSKQAILNILGSGKSVCITVGGGSESLLAAPGKYDLILNRRKGFVRCALQTGASLVPCISFGEPETYNTINQLRHSHPIRRYQRFLERTLGFTIPLAFGRGVFLPYGLLPYPVPLNIVVGAPIEVEKYKGKEEEEKEEEGGPASISRVSNGSSSVRGDGRGRSNDAVFEALVDKYHRQYVTALLELFDQHKEKYAKHASDMRLLE
ncbi:hypothetical protein Ndes2526A_g01348 [Nannochloris sp. 'desiccata']